MVSSAYVELIQTLVQNSYRFNKECIPALDRVKESSEEPQRAQAQSNFKSSGTLRGKSIVQVATRRRAKATGDTTRAQNRVWESCIG